MNVTLFFTILVLLGIVSLILGRRAAQKDVHDSAESFFLSNRTVHYGALTITILATQLGGGTLIGISDEAYSRGWIALLYPLGVYLGLMLLSLGVGAKLRAKHVTTLPELFEKTYGSPLLRKLAGLLSAFSMFMILISQGIASRKFFAALGYDQSWIFVSLWAIVITYTAMGGFSAVIRTDIVQTIFMSCTLLALLVISLCAIPDRSTLFTLPTEHFLQSHDYVQWLLMPMLFMIIGQDMGQRCSSAVSPHTVSKATATAACAYLLLALIPTTLGIIAQQHHWVIPEGHSVLFTAITHLTGPSMTALCACAILMAIISTSNSLLCALSANISVDVWPHNNIFIDRTVTIIAGLAAILCSLWLNNVLPTMLIAYEASIYILFAPLFFSLCFKNPPRWLCWLSVLLGLTLFIFYR